MGLTSVRTREKMRPGRMSWGRLPRSRLRRGIRRTGASSRGWFWLWTFALLVMLAGGCAPTPTAMLPPVTPATASPVSGHERGFLPWTELGNPIYSYPGWSVKDPAMPAARRGAATPVGGIANWA